MANRYWVGGAGYWSDTDHWAASSGGAGGETVPTSSDDVYFDEHSNESGDTSFTVSFNDSGNCNNFNMAFTGSSKITLNLQYAYTLNIYGNFSLPGGSTQCSIYYGTLAFKATSGTKTINTNGVVLEVNEILFDGSGGTFQLSSDLEIAGAAYSSIKLTNGTFDPNSHKVTFSGQSDMYTQGVNYYDLTVEGTASTANKFYVLSNTTISHALDIQGDSAINRILITSTNIAADVGTQRTITSASNTFTNVDFRDIKGAGAGSWDLSAITGGSGDCGGNTDITFTTADDWYWHEGTGNFSDYSKWYTATNGGGSQMASTRVPLPQDTCYFDANSFDSGSQVITTDMLRIGSVVWTGSANTPQWLNNVGTLYEWYGSYTLISGMTFSLTKTIYIMGRGTNTLDSGGQTFNRNIIINSITGRLNLTSDLSILTSSHGLSINSGIFDANDYDVTTGFFSCEDTSSATLYMGSGTWELKRNSNNWFVYTDNNIYCETSTIKISSVLTGDRDFTGGGHTYYNFWNNTTGDYAIIIKDSNTFNDFKINAGRKQTFETGKTQTVTTFTAEGTSGNLITLRSTTTTNATLTKSGGGTIGCDYMDVDYITGSPDTTWYMGTNSTDGGHNSQIYFTDPPVSSATGNFFQLF